MKKNSYTGVSWSSEYYKYKAHVTKDGVTYQCGFHNTEKEAAIARDRKIIEHGLKVKLQVLKPAPR